MFFKEKIEKIKQVSKEKSKKEIREEMGEEYEYHYDPKDYADRSKKLSKKEILLLTLSAYITFAPIFIVLILILILVY